MGRQTYLSNKNFPLQLTFKIVLAVILVWRLKKISQTAESPSNVPLLQYFLKYLHSKTHS